MVTGTNFVFREEGNELHRWIAQANGPGSSQKNILRKQWPQILTIHRKQSRTSARCGVTGRPTMHTHSTHVWYTHIYFMLIIYSQPRVLKNALIFHMYILKIDRFVVVEILCVNTSILKNFRIFVSEIVYVKLERLPPSYGSEIHQKQPFTRFDATARRGKRAVSTACLQKRPSVIHSLSIFLDGFFNSKLSDRCTRLLWSPSAP